MKKYSGTYQYVTRAIAFLMLMAFLVPTGLHAKQFVEFCMMDHHDEMEMVDGHDCCESEKPVNHEENDVQQHDCGVMGICACDIGDTILNDSEWTLITNDFTATLSQQADLLPFNSADERIIPILNHRLGQHAPPLWLMYDTFLM